MSLETAIQGLCDLHIHAGPSISKRCVDALDVFGTPLPRVFAAWSSRITTSPL